MLTHCLRCPNIDSVYVSNLAVLIWRLSSFSDSVPTLNQCLLSVWCLLVNRCGMITSAPVILTNWVWMLIQRHKRWAIIETTLVEQLVCRFLYSYIINCRTVFYWYEITQDIDLIVAQRQPTQYQRTECQLGHWSSIDLAACQIHLHGKPLYSDLMVVIETPDTSRE